MKRITCAETAKLIRQSLKEAFGGFKFTVRSSVYAGGASIRVGWIDGPNTEQVEAITKGFAGAYFDGSIDYKGSIYHMSAEGEPISFGADFIFSDRTYSDQEVQRAINAVYRKFEGNFKSDNIAKPLVEQFRKGELYNVQLSGLHLYGTESVQHEIFRNMHKHSDRLAITPSPTKRKFFVTHDDGYSMKCGSGHSVVSSELR